MSNSNYKHFTRHKDPKIDSVIAGHMKLIVEKVLERCPEVESIILSGGFGRAEGSVIFSSRGIMPFGDYDIYFITSKEIDPPILYRIEMEVKATAKTPAEFDIGLVEIPIRSIGRLSPDISTYELKVASKLLYGKDFRNLIRVNHEDVALSSGFITLSRRSMMMCTVLRKLHTPNLSEEDRTYCVYQCAKVFTEICTALSLLEGFYEPSYERRALLLHKYFDRMEKLRKLVPDLPQKVSEYTDIKLYSTFQNKAPLEAFLEATRYLRHAFTYFMTRYLSRTAQDDCWLNDIRGIYKDLSSLFLKSYVVPTMKKRGFYHKFLTPPIVFGIQLVQNFMHVRNLYHSKGILYLRPLRSVSAPIVKTFMAANLAFHSIVLPELQINDVLLKEAHKYLSKVYPYNVPADTIDWSKWAIWEAICDACNESFMICSSERKRAF